MSGQAVVSITVNPAAPINQPPTANNQSVSTNEDTSAIVTLSASDPDGNPLTYTVLSTPAHGTLSGVAPSLIYQPAGNYSGADSFTFRVNDGQVNSNVATVSITVAPQNDPPAAVGESYSVTSGNVLNVNCAWRARQRFRYRQRVVAGAARDRAGTRHADAEHERIVQLHAGRRLQWS